MRRPRVEHIPNRAPFWSLSRANARVSFPDNHPRHKGLLVFELMVASFLPQPYWKRRVPRDELDEAGLRRGLGAKEKTEIISHVYWGLLIQIVISFIAKIGTFDGVIVSNNIVEDRESREILFPVWEIVYPFLSQWLNPSASEVNPIYFVKIKVNPSSQFTPSRPAEVLDLDTWLLGN